MSHALKFRVTMRSAPPHGSRPADQPRGLGDTVARLAQATGLAAAAKMFERVTGRPCGCEERQRKLNQLFPYKKPGESGETGHPACAEKTFLNQTHPPMKSKLPLLLCLLGLATARAASPVVVFDLEQIVSQPLTNAIITITPLQAVITNGSGRVVANLPHTLKTGNNSQARTNLFPGTYRIEVRTLTPPSLTIYTNLVESGTGTVYSADIKTTTVTPAAGTVAYSQAAADGRFLAWGGSNTVTWTSNGQRWIALVPGGADGVNQAQLTAASNVLRSTLVANDTTTSNALASAITAATNSALGTNWINSRQPASTTLSNLAATGALTNAGDFVASSGGHATNLNLGSPTIFKNAGMVWYQEANLLKLVSDLDDNVPNLQVDAYARAVEFPNPIYDVRTYGTLNGVPSNSISMLIGIEERLTNTLSAASNKLNVASNALAAAINGATNSASVTNWITGRQPASAILTNLAATGALTNAGAFVASSGGHATNLNVKAGIESTLALTVNTNTLVVTNGNVGVGTASPGHALEVNGTNKATHVVATSGFVGTVGGTPFTVDSSGSIVMNGSRRISATAALYVGNDTDIYLDATTSRKVAVGTTAPFMAGAFTIGNQWTLLLGTNAKPASITNGHFGFWNSNGSVFLVTSRRSGTNQAYTFFAAEP